jgi:alpha-tubulin suppressor-like RCC1 family protein
MTIGVKTLVDCVNVNINNVSSSNTLEMLQLSSVVNDINVAVSTLSVASLESLPSAADNKGRIVYVQDKCSYRYSDGTEWSNDFSSEKQNIQAWAWAINLNGRLGDGTTTSRSSPVSVVGGFTDWCQVSAGGNHGLGVRKNGTIWAWGWNDSGELGNNTIISRSSPVSVIGGFTDWKQVSGGTQHSFGLRTNGTLWGWGLNSSGQLGDDTTINQSSPVSVIGGFTDWCQISSSDQHNLAIRTNGSIWAWGNNLDGRLGDNTVITKSSPVSVVGGFTDWCQVSSGIKHSLAIRINGTLWSWGDNSCGQLGNGTIINVSSPVSVVGGFTNWCQTSTKGSHSLAVRTNGSLWAWGFNFGRLGDNTVTCRSSPVSVVGGFTDWCQVSGGFDHTLALRTNGTAWAWGNNTQGRLGDNTIITRSSPVSVVGGINNWFQISASSFSLAIRSTKGF